jgi:hypothetical protein
LESQHGKSEKEGQEKSFQKEVMPFNSVSAEQSAPTDQIKYLSPRKRA